MSRGIDTHGGPQARDGITVHRIGCEVIAKSTGQLCARPAEWRQDDGRLVCHVHRFAPRPEPVTREALAAIATERKRWDYRPDYGERVEVAFLSSEDVPDWRCPAEDSEHWVEHLRLERHPDGELRCVITCGYCGANSDEVGDGLD